MNSIIYLPILFEQLMKCHLMYQMNRNKAVLFNIVYARETQWPEWKRGFVCAVWIAVCISVFPRCVIAATVSAYPALDMTYVWTWVGECASVRLAVFTVEPLSATIFSGRVVVSGWLIPACVRASGIWKHWGRRVPGRPLRPGLAVLPEWPRGLHPPPHWGLPACLQTAGQIK